MLVAYMCLAECGDSCLKETQLQDLLLLRQILFAKTSQRAWKKLSLLGQSTAYCSNDEEWILSACYNKIFIKS